MHKGRPYPYLTQYWATNWLFWPNYAPRRVVLDCFTIGDGDWSLLQPHSPILMDVGVWDVALARLRYTATVHGGLYFLYLDYFDAGTPGAASTCRLLFEIPFYGSGTCEINFGYETSIGPNLSPFIETATTGGFIPAPVFSTVHVAPHSATWTEGGGT